MVGTDFPTFKPSCSVSNCSYLLIDTQKANTTVM